MTNTVNGPQRVEEVARKSANCALMVVFALLTACSTPSKAPTDHGNLASDFQQRYIQPYIAGDVDGWMDVYADDAVALHDGLPPLNGKPAIRGFAEAVAENFVIIRLDAKVDEVRQEGRWAWTRGQFIAEFEAKSDQAPPGVAGVRAGKFMVLWEQQDNGEWLVIMDMGNGMPLPADEN